MFSYVCLTGNAHVVVEKGVCKPVAEDAVSQRCFSNPDSCPQVHQVRSLDRQMETHVDLGLGVTSRLPSGSSSKLSGGPPVLT